MGISFAHFNARGNRRSLDISNCRDIAHLGASKIRAVLQGAVTIAAGNRRETGDSGALSRRLMQTLFSQACTCLIPTLCGLRAGVSRQHQCDLMQLASLQLHEIFDFGGAPHERTVSLHVILDPGPEMQCTTPQHQAHGITTLEDLTAASSRHEDNLSARPSIYNFATVRAHVVESPHRLSTPWWPSE